MLTTPIKRVKIQKYDPAVREAPFQFITLDVIELKKVNYETLAAACHARGYDFRFYYLCSEPGIDFAAIVRGELEDAMGIPSYKHIWEQFNIACDIKLFPIVYDNGTSLSNYNLVFGFPKPASDLTISW